VFPEAIINELEVARCGIFNTVFSFWKMRITMAMAIHAKR
jgi:hypothetical protein